MRIIPFVASAFCMGACAIGWYGFQSLQPKNLKEYLEWQGFKLVSSSEDSTWDSILEERGEVAKRVVGDGVNREELKKYCDLHMPLEKFSAHIQNAIDLCIYNVKTVKGKLIQDKKNLNTFLTDSSVGTDDKYKISYAFRKHNSDFLSLIGHTPEEKEDEWEPAVGKYKQWCQDSLMADLKDSIYDSFSLFCTPKNFSTVEAYLAGKTLLIEDNQSKELETVHAKISNLDSYKADKIENGSEGLKSWCNENLKKSFSEELSVLDEILPKVISRCVKGSQSIDK